MILDKAIEDKNSLSLIEVKDLTGKVIFDGTIGQLLGYIATLGQREIREPLIFYGEKYRAVVK